MGSIVFNPSTQQPESVSVKTGSYTIPAGYYAYVTASVQGADTFSIGGVVALQGITAITTSGTGGAISSIDVETTGATTASYTVPSGYKAEFFIYNLGGGGGVITYTYTFNIGSFSYALTDATNGVGFYDGTIRDGKATRFCAGTGEVISLAVTGAGVTVTKNIFGYAERPNSLNGGQSAGVSSGNFWIAENTVLTTSGGQYTVSLYKNIA